MDHLSPFSETTPADMHKKIDEVITQLNSLVTELAALKAEILASKTRPLFSLRK